MMNRRSIVGLVAAVLAAGGMAPAAAQGNPSVRFVSEDGYAPVDPDRLWDDMNAAISPADPDSVFLPAAGIAPMPLAVLALDTAEPSLERVRYRLRFGTDWIDAPPSAAPLPVSYIEITRFNLGPAIREDLIGSLGADNVADAAAFGVGPHVGWRLVTQPVMGNRASIVAAGRMELDEQSASGETCLGIPCLNVGSVIEDAAPWSEMEPATPDGNTSEALVAYRAADLLLGEIDSIETDSPPTAPSVPDWAIEAVIEVNLGQVEGTELAYRWGGLLDDSVSAIWRRLATLSMGGPDVMIFQAEAYECWRGPDFAPPGAFCP